MILPYLSSTGSEKFCPTSVSCSFTLLEKKFRPVLLSLVLRDGVGALLVRGAAFVLTSLQTLLSVALWPVRWLLTVREAVAETPEVLGLFFCARLVLWACAR